ncbi:MAG: hypothetical protein HKN85_10510, partial [Gammaproteobacteria bacterium]|nr:hypothetical protein [Gammaproteobacteria bacterium]
IILDENLEAVYHNKNADKLFQYLQSPTIQQSIQPMLEKLIRQAPDASAENTQNALLALDFYDQEGEQVYLRTIHSQVRETAHPTVFHLLMVLDRQRADLRLNAELVEKYALTEKEQDVLVRLIHGNTIRDIAAQCFISENTVKSHLKSIFSKTGARSQGTVIGLILTHEAQVLDSYFDSDITTAGGSGNGKHDRELLLSSGARVAYCDYGPANGRPLIVFHSGFGSRLAIPPGYEEVCERTNRRLIIPDRPGIGKTDFIKGHPENWNRQLQEFIDLLGIDQYEVLGSIIASQMAVSYAAQSDSRLQRVILTSPVVLNEKSHTRYLTEILAPAARYVGLSPTFASEIYELWLKSVTLNLDVHYPSMLAASIGSAERALFERQHIIQLLTDVFKEGARQSLEGIVSEMVFCMTPLNLDLSRLTTPFDVWYGTEDKRITQQGVNKIFSEFPNCRLHVREGYSEHLYYALFEEIIE